ncbi:MAG: pilus assembly protein TadG-related protein [Acidimicrobiia bacterium]|nr:pilus assembly protein TadG-related protein [Acidimicrobiia bacterium]
MRHPEADAMARKRAVGDRSAEGDGGYVIAMAALLIVPLLAFVGFATDFGSWYAQGTQIQRAADAAALAGVVYMPEFDDARDAALEAAEKNGYEDGVDGVSVDVTEAGDQRIEVVIKAPGAMFFSGLFLDNPENRAAPDAGGCDSDVCIERRAIAEYILGVPLGNPGNTFGNDPENGWDPGFWPAISSSFHNRSQGDQYAPQCNSEPSSNTGPCSGSSNEYFRPSGYTFAVEVPAGATNVDVQVYDAGFYERGLSTGTGDADYGFAGSTGVYTEYQMYDTDETPFTNADNPPMASAQCNVSGGGNWQLAAEQDSSTYRNSWQTLCTVSNTTSEDRIYYLRVKSSDLDWANNQGYGTNQFSLRACENPPSGCTSGGDQPRIWAVGDMSIYNNVADGDATFYLAEVGEEHANKQLVIEALRSGRGRWRCISECAGAGRRRPPVRVFGERWGHDVLVAMSDPDLEWWVSAVPKRPRGDHHRPSVQLRVRGWRV